MNKVYFTLLVGIAFLSCKDSADRFCDNAALKSISFLSDSIKIKIPATLTEVDSFKYFSKSLVYTRTIRSSDRLSYVWISVNNYSIYTNVHLDFNYLSHQMKDKIRSLKHNKELLLKEETKKIKGINVSFLKSVVKENGKIECIGHIFFILPQEKQVEIVIQLNDHENSDAEKMVSCIFNSMSIK